MTNRVYCAMFMGQGGWLFSQGVYHLARIARAMSVRADVYSYTDTPTAHVEIERLRGHGYKIAGVGYSLGVSALTELQRRCDFDLVFCIAGSSLGINYPINRENTKRSVLWKGHGILSSADDLNFNEVNITQAWHLFAPTDPEVMADFRRELRNVIYGPSKAREVS